MGQQTLKILLVHENESSREQIHHLLTKTDMGGFELECVNVAVVGFRGLCFQYYDVCLIDSDSEGISLLTGLRRVTSNFPIIMLTVNSATEVLNALHQGASDCLLRDDLSAAIMEESICGAIEKARYHERQAEYERLYLGLIENTDEIIYTQDLQGNYTSINRIGEQLTGYTREEILSMSFQEIVAPECVDLVWLNILRMLEDRRPTCYEVVIVTRDCQRIPLGVTHHLIYREGTPIGIQGVARDLTWRIPKLVEETERRFGNNFEH